jgi:hypothetical protein
MVRGVCERRSTGRRRKALNTNLLQRNLRRTGSPVNAPGARRIHRYEPSPELGAPRNNLSWIARRATPDDRARGVESYTVEALSLATDINASNWPRFARNAQKLLLLWSRILHFNDK